MSLIRVKEVQAENFMSIKSAGFNFENRGLVLVEGPNGAGKSALFVETLGYGLFGISERYGSKRNDVINRFSGKDCFVGVVLDIDGVTVEVKTYRKHHRFKDEVFLFIDGEDRRGNSAEHTRAKIERLLDMDYVTFTNSVVFGQAMSKYFSGLPDSEQKTIAERLLGISWISQAYDIVKQEKRKIETEILTNETNANNCQEKIFVNNAKKLQYQSRFNEFEEGRQNEIKKYEELITNEKVMDTSEFEENLKSIEKEIAEYKLQLKEKDSLMLKIKEVEKEISAKEAEHRIYRNNLDVVKAKLKKIECFEGTETCEYCGQIITPDYLEEYKKHLTQDYTNIESVAKKFEDDLILLKEKNLKLTLQLREFEKIEVNKLYAESNYEINKKKMNEIQIDNAKVKERIKSYKKKIDELKQMKNTYEQLINELDSENLELAKQHTIFKNNLIHLVDEMSYNNFWEEGFSNRGLKSFIIESVTPQMNQSAKLYSRALGGNIDIEFNMQKALKSGEMREKFSVEAINRYGSLTYEGNSNGERRLIDAIVMFVLGDLAASRSNKRFSILILDDVFEKLDELICESIINVLRAMTSMADLGDEFSDLPKRESIFVLTHLDYFKSKFTNKIRVEKLHGQTQYREA